MTLLGYTNLKNFRPCLIYELLPQGSLRDRLDCLENSPPLQWHTRISIGWEISMALAYIHESHSEIKTSTIHFDVKSANILLDDHYRAKLADFGLVRNLNPKSHLFDQDTKGTFGILNLIFFPFSLFPFLFSTVQLHNKRNKWNRIPLPRICENRKMQR